MIGEKMEPLNVFMSSEYLEPKCKGCQAIVDYGVTTHFDDRSQTQICNCCGRAQ